MALHSDKLVDVGIKVGIGFIAYQLIKNVEVDSNHTKVSDWLKKNVFNQKPGAPGSGSSGSSGRSGTDNSPERANPPGPNLCGGAPITDVTPGDKVGLWHRAQGQNITSATDPKAYDYGKTLWAWDPAHGGSACGYDQAPPGDKVTWNSVAIHNG